MEWFSGREWGMTDFLEEDEKWTGFMEENGE